jgi:hypothetical protein
MARLTESQIKNLANDAGYYFDGSHWIHDTTGEKRTTDELLDRLVSKKSINDLISDKLRATRGQKSKDSDA